VKICIIFACGVALGVVLGLALCWADGRRLRKRNRELRAALAGRGLQKPETMKRVVWACVINGFAWVWCSYILAALDKPQIAEELSKVALAEIVVPVAAYAFKSVVENLSKNNHWPDKSPAAPVVEEPGEPEGPEPEREEPPDVGL